MLSLSLRRSLGLSFVRSFSGNVSFVPGFADRSRGFNTNTLSDPHLLDLNSEWPLDT